MILKLACAILKTNKLPTLFTSALGGLIYWLYYLMFVGGAGIPVLNKNDHWEKKKLYFYANNYFLHF